jgi:hypothetical protein
MAKLTDLAGLSFGHLIVLRYDRTHVRPSGRTVNYWWVRCRCGKEFGRKSTHLLNRKIKNPQSCGCAIPEQVSARFKTHGLKAHRLYNIWFKMIRRCSSPLSQDWNRYGGRGIRVCERWHDIHNFVADMDSSFKKGLTIDRIDNDGDYTPENCRWATDLEQNRNKNNNRWIEADGERKLLCDWAVDLGCYPSTILSRLSWGWSEQEAATVPIGSRNRWSTYR